MNLLTGLLKDKIFIRAAIVFAMLLAVLVTNRYVDLDTAIMSGFSDVSYYTNIAKAFPHLPKSFITYHHAQRFLFPYIIGMISHISGISLYMSFMIFAVTFLFITIYMIDRILLFYNVSETAYALCMALIIFNPYISRLYLFSPWMITDLMFLFGTSIVILGLVKDTPLIVLTGSVVAILARQTAVLFIPGFFIWLAISESFESKKFRKKFLYFAFVSVVIFSLYKITGYFASIFGGENVNLSHLYTLFFYIKESMPTLKGVKKIYFFVDLIARDTFSLILCAAVLATVVVFCKKEGKLLKDFWLMILFVLLIMFQPIMNGHPNDATRLVSYAVIPLVSALAIVSGRMPKMKFMTSTLPLCLLCYIGSFHHYYSLVHLVIPSFSNYHFAALYYVVVMVMSAVLWMELRRSSIVTKSTSS